MLITITQAAAISESREFDRWFRAINATRRASGVRPHSRAAALVIWLTPGV
ncbi:MAG: hypothetical protein WC829_18255 [Hyphomicrobium sp.]